MKFAELKDLTVDELRKRSHQLREELFQARMKNQMGQLASPIQVRKLRRQIAQVTTAMNHKLAH